MDRNDALALLREHATILRQRGVARLYLFGSTARGEARQDSDVDLFFDDDVSKLSLVGLMTIKETAAEILRGKTDIMTRDSLDPGIRPQAEADAIQVY